MPHPSSLLMLCLLSATAASPMANAQQPTAPMTLCPTCQLGVDPATAVVLVGTNVSIAVPPDTALIAVQLAAQGLDFLAPGGCATPILGTLTDEIIVTLL